MKRAINSLVLWALMATVLAASIEPVGASTPGPYMPALAGEAALIQFEQELEHLRQTLKIPGMSAAVVQDQQVLWAKGFGFADRENQVEADPDTPYHLASVTKPIAATQLMQLVEDGRLSLDDPVAKFGVDVESQGEVLVRHLLTHTSSGSPGKKHIYDGNRYALLGAVIEGVSGESISKQLSENILQPTEMNSTAPNPIPWWGDNMKVGWEAFKSLTGIGKAYGSFPNVYAGLAKPYQFDQDFNIIDGSYEIYFSPAAGLLASVIDLAKFDIALDQNVLLSPEIKETMFEPAVSTYRNSTDLKYGLGWYTQCYNSTRMIWHAGRWPPSVSALYVKFPDEDLTFIILANTDNLSTPFRCLGNGDVLCSTLALNFYKTFVFPGIYGVVVPSIDWDAGRENLVQQLEGIEDENVREVLERELWSHRQVYASVGRGDMVTHLDNVQRQVFGASKLSRIPYINSINKITPDPVPPAMGVWDYLSIFLTAMAWLMLTAVSFLILVFDRVRKRGSSAWNNAAWFLVVLVLGVPGLAAYFLSTRSLVSVSANSQLPKPWRIAIGMTAVRVAFYALWIAAVIMFLVYFLPDTNPGILLGLTYVVPLVVSVFTFSGIIVHSKTGEGYWSSVRKSIVSEFVSMSLVFVGVFPVVFFLLNVLFPGNLAISNPLYWFGISIAGLAGAIVLYPFNLWMAHRRYGNWTIYLSVFPDASGKEFLSPGIRNAWGALLVSVGLLVGSLGLLIWNFA